MPVSPGDRVTLTRNGAAGSVKSLVGDDAAYVALDGGSACTIPLAELAAETKAWPPRSIETK